MSIRLAYIVVVMTGIDSQVGRNVQRYRSNVFSQTELAKLMRDRGWKWTQPTVVAVENGERPLKIGEVMDIAELLNRHVTDLLANSDIAAEVLELARSAVNADANLRTAMASYDEIRFSIAVALDRVPAEQMTGRLRMIGEAWVERTVTQAVAEYLKDGLAESEADRIRAGESAEDRVEAMEQQRDSVGEWVRKVQKADDVEHQAKA